MRLIGLLLAVVLPMCNAAIASTTLTFVTPDGTVGPNEIIEVWVRLATDSGFSFDSSDPGGDGTYGGLDPSLIPEEGVAIAFGQTVPFDEITSIHTSIRFECSGTFTSPDECTSGPDYTFEANLSDDWTFFFMSEYSLEAGASEDFLFGRFVPNGAGAAPGTYEFYNALFLLIFRGVGTFPNPDTSDTVDLRATVTIANTCVTGDSSCSFTRTVVPVPPALWMLASALLGLSGARRRLTPACA